MNLGSIGIFDSGVGGLSILKEITNLLPNESIIYFADQAYFPYGVRKREEIKKRAEKICLFLIEKKVKLIVIACNTATTMAIDYLRKKFSLPFVGLEPAVKPASRLTKKGVIAVLATKRTGESKRHHRLIKEFALEKKVITIDASQLTPLVETGKFNSLETRKVLLKYLLPLKKIGVDVLVLACTHYSFLKEQIRKIMGSRVKIIDPGLAVAKQVKRLLKKDGLLSGQEKKKIKLLTTGEPQKFEALANRLLGFSVYCDKIYL